MIDAVRGVLDDAKAVDERIVKQYNDLKDAFSGRYYLSDEQLLDLQDNGLSLNDFKKAMTGKITIISKDTAKRSITGGSLQRISKNCRAFCTAAFCVVTA